MEEISFHPFHSLKRETGTNSEHPLHPSAGGHTSSEQPPAFCFLPQPCSQTRNRHLPVADGPLEFLPPV